jgi:hypothetical protein
MRKSCAPAAGASGGRGMNYPSARQIGWKVAPRRRAPREALSPPNFLPSRSTFDPLRVRPSAIAQCR